MARLQLSSGLGGAADCRTVRRSTRSSGQPTSTSPTDRPALASRSSCAHARHARDTHPRYCPPPSMERITVVERGTFTPLFDWCVGRWKEDARQPRDAAALLQFFYQFAKDMQGGGQAWRRGEGDRKGGRDGKWPCDLVLPFCLASFSVLGRVRVVRDSRLTVLLAVRSPPLRSAAVLRVEFDHPTVDLDRSKHRSPITRGYGIQSWNPRGSLAVRKRVAHTVQPLSLSPPLQAHAQASASPVAAAPHAATPKRIQMFCSDAEQFVVAIFVNSDYDVSTHDRRQASGGTRGGNEAHAEARPPGHTRRCDDDDNLLSFLCFSSAVWCLFLACLRRTALSSPPSSATPSSPNSPFNSPSLASDPTAILL